MAMIKQRSFPLPDEKTATTLIMLDKKIETVNGWVNSALESDNFAEKADKLAELSASYQFQKDAIISNTQETVLPLVIPKEFLELEEKNILFDYYQNAFVVQYNEEDEPQFEVEDEDLEEETSEESDSTYDGDDTEAPAAETE